MKEHFEMDRYDFSRIIEKIKMFEAVPDVILDDETDIEIYGGAKVSKDILITILKEFNVLDNLVQDECRKEYEKSNFNIYDYQFAPSWMKVSDNEVVIGYWGVRVNSSFDKVFIKVDGVWQMQY